MQCAMAQACSDQQHGLYKTNGPTNVNHSYDSDQFQHARLLCCYVLIITHFVQNVNQFRPEESNLSSQWNLTDPTRNPTARTRLAGLGPFNAPCLTFCFRVSRFLEQP